jgi:hypothetical protein
MSALVDSEVFRASGMFETREGALRALRRKSGRRQMKASKSGQVCGGIAVEVAMIKLADYSISTNQVLFTKPLM